ncbi:hypothetical protein GO495_17160 [Chitinophaga oryziterrae]|uniref:Uncharacterized protein n=1 Tax=Chitinophaga oryziterrae TaxID=1031224 RepID=A0A6N8JBI6_9BACT|nr:hypothetical protein [Chitinophaga oryziterrae]MVT42324.1 hypothetical protein [Chitinophaga oryziterrae]
MKKLLFLSIFFLGSIVFVNAQPPHPPLPPVPPGFPRPPLPPVPPHPHRHVVRHHWHHRPIRHHHYKRYSFMPANTVKYPDSIAYYA